MRSVFDFLWHLKGAFLSILFWEVGKFLARLEEAIRRRYPSKKGYRRNLFLRKPYGCFFKTDGPVSREFIPSYDFLFPDKKFQWKRAMAVSQLRKYIANGVIDQAAEWRLVIKPDGGLFRIKATMAMKALMDAEVEKVGGDAEER